jgi:hypothetical protein
MKPNLDELKAEIPQQIESRGLTLFPGFSRVMDQVAMVFWNSKKNPDYHEFLDAAEKTGAKVIVFYDREFAADLIEDALEHLEESDLPRDEQRSYERRLREMRVYDGFTCAIELSFDLNGVAYLFELRTDWYEELTEILDDIEASMPDDDDEDDEDAHLGGYFSKN